MTPRIYFPHPLKTSAQIELDESISRHLLTVLRLNIGETLQIFNGEGGAYLAVLKSIQRKHAIVELGEWIADEVESPLSIHLGQAISRGERMDYSVQKSVELGVTEITPLFAERCGVQLNKERQGNRLHHWQKIAISAAEQSGRCRVPIVNPPQNLIDFLASTTRIGFICTPKAGSRDLRCETMATLPDKLSAVTVLIGPEGGFSPQEIQQAERAGFHTLSLGSRILRTETAAVVAISLLQHRWGDVVF